MKAHKLECTKVKKELTLLKKNQMCMIIGGRFSDTPTKDKELE